MSVIVLLNSEMINNQTLVHLQQNPVEKSYKGVIRSIRERKF